MNIASPQPVTAGLFHAGNTCPFCQEAIDAGQLIVTCLSCGSMHHETCWTHKQGCSSYHCDRSVRMPDASRRPDIVLSADEVATAPPPPVRVRRAPGEAAAAYMAPKPTRHSRLAWLAAVIAGLSLLGVAGAFSASVEVVLLGIVFALVAIFAGVAAMVRINNPENRLAGLPVAGAAVLLPVVMVMVYFVVLYGQLNKSQRQTRMDLRLQESLPTKAELARQPPAIARAMRASVVIRHTGALLEGQSYGSGIVLKVTGDRAFILTNKHVIGEDKSGLIDVTFYTGEESRAEVVWSAPEGVDLAILACEVIALDDYQPVEYSNDPPPTGTSVFAIGNPMGLSWTYTEGSISGFRSIAATPHSVELYQTQTPINSGNSGGGLYLLDGRLIGVNTLTENKQFAEGLSFAISVNTLLNLLSSEQQGQWLHAPDREVER